MVRARLALLLLAVPPAVSAAANQGLDEVRRREVVGLGEAQSGLQTGSFFEYTIFAAALLGIVLLLLRFHSRH